MLYLVEQLVDARTYQPAARHGHVGRVWRKVAAPVARLAVAERVQKLCMIDNPTITRIRPVKATPQTPRVAY